MPLPPSPLLLILVSSLSIPLHFLSCLSLLSFSKNLSIHYFLIQFQILLSFSILSMPISSSIFSFFYASSLAFFLFSPSPSPSLATVCSLISKTLDFYLSLNCHNLSYPTPTPLSHPPYVTPFFHLHTRILFLFHTLSLSNFTSYKIYNFAYLSEVKSDLPFVCFQFWTIEIIFTKHVSDVFSFEAFLNVLVKACTMFITEFTQIWWK